jgi:hypothetical protein
MEPTGQPERIFHTGRNARTIFLTAFGAVWFCFGLVILFVPGARGDETPSVASYAIAYCLTFLGGGALVGASLMVFLRSALMVYPEGVMVVDWRGRPTFVAWRDLDSMIVLFQVAHGPRGSCRTATLYLAMASADGSKLRVKAAHLGSQAAYEEVTSTLAARADLACAGKTQLGRRAVEEVWRKGSDSGARWTAGPQQRGRD